MIQTKSAPQPNILAFSLLPKKHVAPCQDTILNITLANHPVTHQDIPPKLRLKLKLKKNTQPNNLKTKNNQ